MVLIQKLLNNNFLEIIVSILQRLNEKKLEESEIYHKSLGILDNLMDLDKKIIKLIADKTKIIHLIVKRLHTTIGIYFKK